MRAFTCGKFDHLIRLAFNIILLPIVLMFSRTSIVNLFRRVKSLSKALVFLAFIVAIGFIIYHELMLVRKEGEKYKFE